MAARGVDRNCDAASANMYKQMQCVSKSFL